MCTAQFITLHRITLRNDLGPIFHIDALQRLAPTSEWMIINITMGDYLETMF